MRTIIIMTIFLFIMTCVVVGSTHRKIRKKRAWVVDPFTIEEESPGPFPYVLGTVNLEQSQALMFYLTGRGVTEEPEDVLSINNTTGEIFVHKKVDYETHQSLSLKIEAWDINHNLYDLRVEVRILDINDHAPAFRNKYYETTLSESVLQGELVTTVSASDSDDSDTPNGIFTFTLESVTPKTDNVEFYIKQNKDTGSIYFKGCLDYEEAQNYTLLIKATDNGDKVQLSSTSTVVLNIIDKNNNLPEITNHTGPGKIKEQEFGVEVLRLKVSDNDSPGSPAWKAKFTLHGDPENYFKIHTDPNTNDGILTVIKAMDYEQQTSRNVSVSVENEELYFFCKMETPTPPGVWDGIGAPKLYTVTITVEDVNEPPEFVPPVRSIMSLENTDIGTHLVTLTAIDPDKTYGNSFHFVKGEDKDNWVNVDPKTGQVSVAKKMDRESPFVEKNAYSVIVYAVNNDQPPQTGTGTLIIHLVDQNDNVPFLKVNTVSMCLSDKETMTKITAVDQDLPPYGAPFHYELLGNVKGKWRIEPQDGTTVNLVRENTVYSGHYQIPIKILDNQGYGLVQNLSITVCNCTITPNCHVSRSFTTRPSLSTIGIIIFAFLVLLGTLLMALQLCKTKKIMIMEDDLQNGALIVSNIEMPGTDCQCLYKLQTPQIAQQL
ncbi:cadherin-like protein 26 [Pangasianodon hypophthalmus]|uniref:cadherin-like protein 26 n=1 Tax=Pangasianodon hypophthalmus TaxID=310915 RepID=UPI00230806CB|nr:cadherin-like protein 26 [Pangasianodon hypophthalmus]